jgi:hypothetical protein
MVLNNFGAKIIKMLRTTIIFLKKKLFRHYIFISFDLSRKVW